MADHHIETVFESDTIRVHNYHCSGHTPHGEEYALAHEVVFLRSGTFLRYDTFGKVMADVNQILFFYAGQAYQISHPLSGGDKCTVLAIEPSILLEIIRSFDGSVDDRPERPFPVGHIPSEISLMPYLRMNDPLQTEEQLLMAVTAVIQAIYKAPFSKSFPYRQNTLDAYLEITNQVQLFLNIHFGEHLRLQDIANVVNVSPYALCRIFRQITHFSIHQYLQRLRLLHAYEQLVTCPKTSLTELALELGFASHSHFTATFTREFGFPPSHIVSKILKG